MKKKSKARARRTGSKIIKGLQEALDTALTASASPRATELAKSFITKARAKKTTDAAKIALIAGLIDSALRSDAARGEVKGIEETSQGVARKYERQIIQGFLDRVMAGCQDKREPRTMTMVFSEAKIIAQYLEAADVARFESKATATDRPQWHQVPADLADRLNRIIRDRDVAKAG